LNTQEVISGGVVKLINAHNKMNKVLKALGIGSFATVGLTLGFNLGMVIGYIKDADLAESKLRDNDTPSFPV
tara:strand:+ start:1368 stop:1583 length:216 start_codon:yes stop_codon:yes gene_type:complete